MAMNTEQRTIMKSCNSSMQIKFMSNAEIKLTDKTLEKSIINEIKLDVKEKSVLFSYRKKSVVNLLNNRRQNGVQIQKWKIVLNYG